MSARRPAWPVRALRATGRFLRALVRPDGVTAARLDTADKANATSPHQFGRYRSPM